MSWNGAGVYSLPRSWSTDKAGSVAPSATNFDQQDNDIATALNNCLCKDGQNAMTGTLNVGSHAVTGVTSLTATGTVTAAAVTATGTITAATFSGSAASLTSIPAANITGSHTLPDGVLSTNVPLLNAANVFTSAVQTINASGAIWKATDGTRDVRFQAEAAKGSIGTFSNHPFSIFVNNSSKFTIDTSGNYDFGSGAVTTAGSSAAEVGYKGTPQNVQNGNYGLVLADAGGLIAKQSGAGNTITIPANGSVAFPIGTIITIDNDSGNSVSIAITTDVLELAGTGTTGTRTLSDNGSCTIQKIASTKWRIAGTGLS